MTKEKKVKKFIFRGWFISQLRKAYRNYPPYYNTRNLHKETYYIKSKKGKDVKRVKFQCNVCKEWFSNNQISVDHVQPVVDPVVGFPMNEDGTDNWSEYIKRLYCDITNLQILCDACHTLKSGKERKRRNKKKKA